MLAYPRVNAPCHRNYVPELVPKSDVLVPPGLEDDFVQVCKEAMACGCLPLF